MEAQSAAASPAAQGAATAPAAVVPAAAAGGLRIALGLAAASVALGLAFAGYRLYEKDRAETAAELVRIRAYLDVRAQAEAVPAAARDKPQKLHAQEDTPVAAAAEPRASKAVEATARRAPKARPAEAKAAAKSAQPVKASARPPERPKGVDRLWTERVARECAPGFVGLICREWLKFDLCCEHEAWGKASICPAVQKPAPPTWPDSFG